MERGGSYKDFFPKEGNYPGHVIVHKFYCNFVFSQSSNMLNQARLKVLKARDDHVSRVLENAKAQLVTISKDQSRYPQLLEGLIGQVINIC